MNTRELIEMYEDACHGLGYPKGIYHPHTSLRQTGITYDMTQVEQDEYNACKDDAVHFAEHFCYARVPSMNTEYPCHALQLIKLTKTQKALIGSNERNIALLQERQVGATTTLVFKCVHDVLFKNKKVAIIAGNDRAIEEFIGYFKTVSEKLPYRMQKGVRHCTKHAIEFEDGSAIFKLDRQTMSPSVANGINLIVLYTTMNDRKKEAIDSDILPDILPVVASVSGQVVYEDYIDNESRYKNRTCLRLLQADIAYLKSE